MNKDVNKLGLSCAKLPTSLSSDQLKLATNKLLDSLGCQLCSTILRNYFPGWVGGFVGG